MKTNHCPICKGETKAKMDRGDWWECVTCGNKTKPEYNEMHMWLAAHARGGKQ